MAKKTQPPSNSGKEKSSPNPEPRQSLWLSAQDVWPFMLGVLLCGLASYFLNFAGQGYVQPNSLTTGSTVTLMAAGACALASAFGLVHLGFASSGKITWIMGGIIGLLLLVAAFFVGGRTLSPGVIFAAVFFLLTPIGFLLGKRADNYRSRFPHKPKFLRDWE